MSLITRPMRPVFASDQDTTATLDDGIYTIDELPSFLGEYAAGIIDMGMLDGTRHRGLDILPIMSGASAGDTVSLKVFRVSPIMDIGAIATVRAYLLEHMYTLTLTASTMEYDPGDIGDDSTVYRAIDEIVLAATSDRATHIQSVTGASIAIDSNTANTQGLISMPDLNGAHGVILEPVCSNGLFNALHEIKT